MRNEHFAETLTAVVVMTLYHENDYANKDNAVNVNGVLIIDDEDDERLVSV